MSAHPTLGMTIGPVNCDEPADDVVTASRLENDDAYIDQEDYEDLDDEWCSAPGRGGQGLCCDDLCRGAGVCQYEGSG